MTLRRLRVALAALALAGATARGAEVPAVDTAPFFRHADFSALRLSPSGKYIAALVPSQGRVGIGVVDLAMRQSKVIVTLHQADVASVEWVNDNRLVFSQADFPSGLGEQRGGGLMAVDRDGGEVRVLAPTAKNQIDTNHYVLRYTALHTALRDGSDDVLVVANDYDARYTDIYRLNTRTGRKTLKSFDKPGRVIRWIVDRDGEVRGAITDERSLITRAWWRPAVDAKWEPIGEYGLRDARTLPVAFDGDGSLIVASNVGRDTYALFRWDAAKKAPGDMVAGYARADIDGGLLYDRRQRKIVGVHYEAEQDGIAWFDDEWARIGAGLDAARPGAVNVPRRGDNGVMLVTSYSDREPASWYLYDPGTRRLEFIATSRKAIKADAMPSREPLRYQARDGLEIPAFLTLPRDRPAKALPLVVLVHGGPNVRGVHWQWNAEAAYLASLGYAVLEPEFRGSLGWGRRLFEAGWKQWGRAMQDDLDDGMDHLARQGTIDPKRACIVGASYGGYAVMMGLARDPDRWRCGVNYVGVTDINMMFDVGWSDFATSDYLQYAAKELIGDPEKDAAQLKASSPLENAARIRAPVLMVYGGLDFRVPLVHGERMRDALAKQGAPFEWVVYPEEGHGFLLEKNRFDFYGRVARFLATWLPPG